VLNLCNANWKGIRDTAWERWLSRATMRACVIEGKGLGALEGEQATRGLGRGWWQSYPNRWSQAERGCAALPFLFGASQPRQTDKLMKNRQMEGG